jgi:hypothetical protein
MFFRHSVLVWVGIPSCAVLQGIVAVPGIQPTCTASFANWTLVFIVLLEAHHVHTEMRAWDCLKSLLSGPERTVMRQVGVLGARRRLVCLGILEELGIWAEMLFPFFAMACDNIGASSPWIAAWQEFPLVGRWVAKLVSLLHVWVLTLLLSAATLAVKGIFGILFMPKAPAADAMAGGVPCDVSLGWACAAETAIMPSVAMLAEELAKQRRFVFEDKCHVGADKASTMAKLGRASYEDAIKSELFSQEYEERFNTADSSKSSILIRVVICSCLQIWLQTSFVMLSFAKSGLEAKIKVYVGLSLVALQAIRRAGSAALNGKITGVASFVLVSVCVAWACTENYKTYTCPDHLWNVAVGCVSATATLHNDGNSTAQ